MKKFLSIILLASGCGGVVSLGSAPSEQPLGVCTLPSSVDAGGHPSSAAPTPSSALSGTWVGHIAGGALPSGDDTITLELTERTDRSIDGALIFGIAPAPPPPADPHGTYPPGFDPVGPDRIYTYSFAGEGFRYTVTSASVASGRLSLSVNPEEVFTPWCDVQCPVDDGSGGYRCLPNWPSHVELLSHEAWQIDPSTGAEVARNWTQFYLCAALTPVCTCTSARCAVAPVDGGQAITLGASFGADAMDGEISGVLGSHEIHLLRTK